jgi:heparan-alpha-glucosaminide N-acetyltransferase
LSQTAVLAMEEHGSYTLVVYGPQRPPVLVQDRAAPHWTFRPIAAAGGVLLGLGLLHRLLGALVLAVHAAATKKRTVDADAAGQTEACEYASAAGTGAKGSRRPERGAIHELLHWTFCFLGFDEKIRVASAVAAVTAVSPASASSASEAASLRSPLLASAAADAASDEVPSKAASHREPLSLQQVSIQSPPTATAASSASASSPAVAAAAAAARVRIRSIDTLRGLCLACMIFVNYGGGAYWFFDHSQWDGLTWADLLFPIFVWTQGVSMAISFASERRRVAPGLDGKLAMLRKIVVRSGKLYLLGMLMNGGAVLTNWRIPGVLQYFSVSYLVVGSIEAFVPPLTSSRLDGSAKDGAAVSKRSFMQNLWTDVGRYLVQWMIMLLLGLAYLLIQYRLPVPGCPTGYTGPGGYANGGELLGMNCTGGAHRHVDMLIFGARHIFSDLNKDNTLSSAATCADVDAQGHPIAYNCDVYDPEGALGYLTASWMCWLGLQAGRVFVEYRSMLQATSTGAVSRAAAHRAHIVRLFCWGIVVGLVGGSLCGFSQYDGLIPLNKNLWSPSFILCMASIGFCMLGLLYFVVDAMSIWSGGPFCYTGMNSIVIYCCHELLSTLFPFQMHQGAAVATHSEAIVSNLVGVCTWLAVARQMYMYKFFVTI